MCPPNGVLGAVRAHEEEQWGLFHAFQMLDRDGDGAIDCHDLSAFFGSCAGLSLSPEEATAMITMADADGDGKVRLEEFERLMAGEGECMALMEKQREEAETATLRKAFEVLDADEDGQLGRADLRAAMSMCGQPFSTNGDDEVDAMLDGVAMSAALDFDAFSTLMAAPHVHRPARLIKV